jgi:K(+)-stimulated pyrophosphate-energized sodium pump
MSGKVAPDYARVVGISTASAQKELIPLATIAVLMPLAIGLILQVEALGGFLAGIILSGQLLAVFMSNAGGAWDNAKKAIEDEPRDLKANTGKGSERHKAGVVGDTVGDPLKDTAGPALNPMIKVANLVSLLAAPIIVKYPLQKADGGINWIVLLVAVLMLAATVWAISQSNRQVETQPAAKPAAAVRTTAKARTGRTGQKGR